jgi:DNA-binding response OmpR family regulator
VKPSILQIAYYSPLLHVRQQMLENAGYEVVSALGNDQAMSLATAKNFDLIVVGFSGPRAERASMVRWVKQHRPETPVITLLARETEHFPEADCETFSEDPRVWLAAIANCIERI